VAHAIRPCYPHRHGSTDKGIAFMTACPCCSGRELDACCGPILAGTPAATAEALMRSRYSSVVLNQIDHLEATHAPELKEEFNRSWAEGMARDAKWQGLEILAVTGGGPEDETGVVEFAARFKLEGSDRLHHERSQFRKEAGRWVYVSGEMNPKGEPRRVTKVGRNDPCACGSGRKYKKCCGA
jgi:SEC-C motif-containing protein